MRPNTAVRVRARRARTLSPPVTFICSDCECVEHRCTPALPKGWVTRQLGNDLFAYCPDCGGGEDPAVVAAQLRHETIAFAALAPVILAAFSACWMMLPA